jgi:hypothetical protein
MAIVEGSKFLSIPASTDTIERGSAVANARQQYYTIEDIVAEAVADGNLGVTGDLSVGGDLSIVGDGSTADLTVNAAATVGTTLDVTGNITGATITGSSLAVSALDTAPTVASTGTAGEIILAPEGLYVCLATDTWSLVTATTVV